MTNLPIHPSSRKKWSVEEFDRLSELGAFGGQKIELLEGEISDSMPQNESHARCVLLLQYKLMQIFLQGYVVRVQLPLALESSKPEPDLAIVAGNLRAPLEMPTTAILVVEVSDSTLQTDREVKSHIYARAGIDEYWIVNLNARQVEVRRQPRADDSQPLGFAYGFLQTLDATEELSLLALSGVSFPVADILP